MIKFTLIELIIVLKKYKIKVTRAINLILLATFFPMFLFSQETDSTEQEIFYKVDISAEYPGGYAKLFSDINKEIKYPKEAKKAKIEGKVYVSFVIDSTGMLLPDSVRVTKGLGYGLDEEAIRVMKSLNRWKPAHVTVLGRDVPQRIVMPITFRR